MGDVKNYLYAWCGRRRLTPAYEIRAGGGRGRQTFLCEVRVRGGRIGAVRSPQPGVPQGGLCLTPRSGSFLAVKMVRGGCCASGL